jgi:intracellular sulfur oxidation DsrE/DsrF family protein
MANAAVMAAALLLAAGAVLACSPRAASSATENHASRHRVVIEVNVDGPERWEGILNNVDNLQKAFGADQTTIEVVAHAKGLGLLLATDEALKGRMQAEHDKGVTFAACENTMRKQNVTKDQLMPFVTTVDSGVAEVVRKQEAGWAYIKGGG